MRKSTLNMKFAYNVFLLINLLQGMQSQEMKYFLINYCPSSNAKLYITYEVENIQKSSEPNKPRRYNA